MNKRKIAAIILATMITNLSATTIDVLAQELNTKNNSKVEVSHDDESHQARVSKFDLYNSDKLDAYNQEFQVSRSNIKSSPSSLREAYISNSFAKPFPLAESLLAEYTILSILVISLNVTTTSFVKFASLGFPVSQ